MNYATEIPPGPDLTSTAAHHSLQDVSGEYIPVSHRSHRVAAEVEGRKIGSHGFTADVLCFSMFHVHKNGYDRINRMGNGSFCKIQDANGNHSIHFILKSKLIRLKFAKVLEV